MDVIVCDGQADLRAHVMVLRNLALKRRRFFT